MVVKIILLVLLILVVAWVITRLYELDIPMSFKMYVIILLLGSVVLLVPTVLTWGVEPSVNPDDPYICSSLGGVWGNEKCFYGGEVKTIDEIKERVGL
mgnify:CR=1 FL=1